MDGVSKRWVDYGVEAEQGCQTSRNEDNWDSLITNYDETSGQAQRCNGEATINEGWNGAIYVRKNSTQLKRGSREAQSEEELAIFLYADNIIFSFNIQSDTAECLQVKYMYERMIAGYYRSRI